MGVVKEGVSCVMTVLVTTVLLVWVLPSHAQGVTGGDFRHSETCYGTGNCSLHMLQCSGSSRLAVLDARYGFKPRAQADACVSAVTGDVCPDHCCRFNASSDCKQPFSADNLERVQSECSHSDSCHIRAQRGDNILCNTAQRGITSTVSILRAVCVQDAATINPCSNATVIGHSVALYLTPPAPSSPCQCTLHKTNTSTTSSDTVNLYVYEVESSSPGWELRVENGAGTTVQELRGVVRVFPATSLSSPASFLPLTVTTSVTNLTASPHRVWLGFRGEVSSVTLRCGQDAIDYAMSLTTTTPITTTTTATTTTTPATTTSEATTTLQATTTTIASPLNTTSNATTATIATTTTVPSTSSQAEQTSRAGTSGAESMPLTSEDPKKASTDVIVYVAVGVSALILCAFLYVCVRRLRKKGCPHCCPAPCRLLDCAKRGPQAATDRRHHPPGSATPTITITSDGDGRRRRSQGGGRGGGGVANGGGALSNGRLGNGHVVQLTGEGREGGSGGGVPFAFTQRRCSFEHLKRHRGSIQSLRRASFSNLEDIKETEEDEGEEDGNKRTPHNHHHPHHSSNHLHPYHPHLLPLPPEEQEDIIKIVEERIATIVDDTASNNDDKTSDDDDDDDDSVFDHDKSSICPREAAQALKAGADNPQEVKESPQGGASVVFHLGSSESSDPDVEHSTKL